MDQGIAVLGVGLHPWGKWGRSFKDYAMHAARAAMKDAGESCGDIGYVAAAGTVRGGYEGSVAGTAVAASLGLGEVEATTVYAACASGTHAIAAARDRILAGRCAVALVVGADTAEGLDSRASIDRPVDLNDARTALGLTNAAYLGLRARRRMHANGTTTDDLDAVRIKNSAHGLHNVNARFRLLLCGGDIERSPMIASPLRLLHVSAYSDGAAALVVSSLEYAKRRADRAVQIRALTLSAAGDEELTLPYLSAREDRPLPASVRARNVATSLERAGVGPPDLSLAELYDVSSVSELEWYERIGLCADGDAEGLLRSGATRLGGRIPVNVSGGLTSFGEAVSAQALAQVCEITWQLRGACGARQVERAVTGLAVCDGLYGHVASTVLCR